MSVFDVHDAAVRKCQTVASLTASDDDDDDDYPLINAALSGILDRPAHSWSLPCVFDVELFFCIPLTNAHFLSFSLLTGNLLAIYSAARLTLLQLGRLAVRTSL